jgi:hypothetical protein
MTLNLVKNFFGYQLGCYQPKLPRPWLTLFWVCLYCDTNALLKKFNLLS